MPFDFSSIHDFDRHIALSIPNYDGLMEIVSALFCELMPEDGVCVDIGCSTGTMLNRFAGMRSGRYVGIDSVDIRTSGEFEFLNGKASEKLLAVSHADFVTSIFTLQFMGRHERRAALASINRLVEGGAFCVIAEKTYIDDVVINSVLHKRHYKGKRQHFTDKEIMDKDFDLLGSMHCRKASQVQSEIDAIGDNYKIWQSYNFSAWVIVPENNFN